MCVYTYISAVRVAMCTVIQLPVRTHIVYVHVIYIYIMGYIHPIAAVYNDFDYSMCIHIMAFP